MDAIVIDFENRKVIGCCKASGWKEHMAKVREIIQEGVENDQH
jgi:hypothetical protein